MTASEGLDHSGFRQAGDERMHDIGPLRDRRIGSAAVTIDRSHSDLAGEVPARTPPNLTVVAGFFVCYVPRHS